MSDTKKITVTLPEDGWSEDGWSEMGITAAQLYAAYRAQITDALEAKYPGYEIEIESSLIHEATVYVWDGDAYSAQAEAAIEEIIYRLPPIMGMREDEIRTLIATVAA